MTKVERIELMAKELEMKKSEFEKLEKKFLGAAKKVLIENGEIKLEGLGTLKAMKVEERAGRNPRTGDEIVIPEHKAIKFKVDSKLKEEIK